MPRATKVKNAGDKPYPKTKVPKKGTGGYDRSVMVAEVAKVSFTRNFRADNRPPRPTLPGSLNRSARPSFVNFWACYAKLTPECKDTLRKTVLPALLAGGEWCTTGSGWTAEMKLTLVVEVFSVSHRSVNADIRRLPPTGPTLPVSSTIRQPLRPKTCGVKSFIPRSLKASVLDRRKAGHAGRGHSKLIVTHMQSCRVCRVMLERYLLSRYPLSDSPPQCYTVFVAHIKVSTALDFDKDNVFMSFSAKSA